MTRWRRRSVASLLVLRYLLISNGSLLSAVGFISLLYVERPAGVIAAGTAWLLAGILFGCVPLTDPYRSERRSVRKSRQKSRPTTGPTTGHTSGRTSRRANRRPP